MNDEMLRNSEDEAAERFSRFALRDKMSGRFDVSHFRETREHMPVEIARLRRGVWNNLRGIRVLDMCIHMPGRGWAVPSQLGQFRPAIASALLYEMELGAPLEYVYITVDQGIVQPDESQRRPGWHSDAFVVDPIGGQTDIVAATFDGWKAHTSTRIERTYLAYDAIPTMFADGPWDLPNPSDCDAVLRDFDQQAEGKPKRYYPCDTLLCITPYAVHAAQPNPFKRPIRRTFIKIQFSEHRYNRSGNTLNLDFDYTGWNWVERNPAQRAHRYAGPETLAEANLARMMEKGSANA